MGLYYFLILHILICAIFIFLIVDTKKSKNRYIMLTMGLFAFLVMFRSENVGNDTGAYIRLFESISSGIDLSMHKGRFEIGFLYLNKILSLLSNNYQILFIVTGIYIYFVYGKLIYKYSDMVWLSVFLFFAMGNFDLSMSGIRQMLALATLILSYEYIVRKKPIKFILTVFLAISFHNAAIVFLLAYPLSKFKLTKELILSVIAGSIGIYLMFEPMLIKLISIFPRYSYYLNGTYLDGETRIATILSLTIVILLFLVSEMCNHSIFYKQNSSERSRIISKKTKDDEIQSVFLLIACGILFISLKGTILSRFENVYNIFTIIYYPNAVAKIKDKKTRLIIVVITIMMFVLYSTIIKLYRPEWQSTYPYSFFWN